MDFLTQVLVSAESAQRRVLLADFAAAVPHHAIFMAFRGSSD
jgi:hypothetical protein